jgi:hypothetical protein
LLSAQLDLVAEVVNEPDAALLGAVVVDHDLGNRVVSGHQPEVFGVNVAGSHAVRLPGPGPRDTYIWDNGPAPRHGSAPCQGSLVSFGPSDYRVHRGDRNAIRFRWV